MEKSAPLVITISRQFGSGGSYIGQQLAKKLNIYYADREILRKAAERLSVVEEELYTREEKTQSLWKYFAEISTSGLGSDGYAPPKNILPTAQELFITESEIIQEIAKERSAVIIGRCGFHILREHTNIVKVYLHANISFRIKRIRELHKISDFEAQELIKKNDKERNQYIKTFTETDWTDARKFDLCVDTSEIGTDKSVELILNYVRYKS
jgi:cytidylate kinase